MEGEDRRKCVWQSGPVRARRLFPSPSLLVWSAVCEYVADEWAAQVAERSGVALAEVFPGLASRPSGAENVWAHEAEEQKLHELAFGTAAKRQKVEAGGAVAKQTSTKQASMAKAAKGTKSITAFFGRKKKRAP